jgi:hypothetical protein
LNDIFSKDKLYVCQQIKEYLFKMLSGISKHLRVPINRGRAVLAKDPVCGMFVKESEHALKAEVR